LITRLPISGKSERTMLIWALACVANRAVKRMKMGKSFFMAGRLMIKGAKIRP
jgi:hypothetical protein